MSPSGATPTPAKSKHSVPPLVKVYFWRCTDEDCKFINERVCDEECTFCTSESPYEQCWYGEKCKACGKPAARECCLLDVNFFELNSGTKLDLKGKGQASVEDREAERLATIAG